MDTLSKHYEEYDDYLEMCKNLNLSPLYMVREWNEGEVSFYEHIRDILNSHGVQSVGELYVQQEKTIKEQG